MQTIFKREKAREASSVSGSGACDVCSSTWEHYSQMQFIEVTGDTDSSYTSLDTERFSPQSPKKIRKPTKSGEEDAKIELWKSLTASLKPQEAPQQKPAKNELSYRANLFGKVIADSPLQYEPGDWSYIKKKVMDVFYDFEQQKLTGRSNYKAAPFNLNHFQGNQFRQGQFLRVVVNIIKLEFDWFKIFTFIFQAIFHRLENHLYLLAKLASLGSL